MKQKIISLILVLSMLLTIASSLGINSVAASTLTITSPSNDDHVSKSDPPKLKWSKVTGAAGYRVTVVNVDSGKDLARNHWTTSTSYSLSSLFDDNIGTNEYPLLKIWVRAMASKDDNPELTFLSSDIIYIKACEAPQIDVPLASIITPYGANFYVNVEKNFGSAILDAGVYIGTSLSIGSAKKYSAKRYSESGVLNSGTMILKIDTLEPDTKYYFWAYAENGVDETISSRKNFTTKEAPGSLTVSATSITWDDGADNSKTVTVNSTESYSYNIEYDVGSDVINSGYNYEWLNVTQSGSSLILKPNRANYSEKDRTAYVTVTSNGKSKEIVVTQAKCSESAPTLQLWRGDQSNILNDGQSFGTFDLPQNVIEVNIISKNIRKVYAQLLSSTGELIGECTNINKISFNTSSLTAGTYSIKVFASNSATSNDYWSQRPFESMTVYFALKKSGGSVIITNPDFTNISSAKDKDSSKFPQVSSNAGIESADWTKENTIVYVQQKFPSANVFDSSIWETGGGKGDCTRASLSSALSYLNLTGAQAIPKAIGNTIGTSTKITTCGCPDHFTTCYDAPYDSYIKKLGCSLQLLKYCQGELTVDNFVKYYNRYANDTSGRYSPLVLYTNYWVPSDENPHKSMHTLLIIGHDPNENDVFYVLDPGNTSQLVKIRLTVVDGQIRIKEKTANGVTGEWKTNAYNVNYTPCQVWQIVNDSIPDTHTHSYVTKHHAEHPHKEYKVCDCGDIIETGNTVRVTGCTECYPVPETCPHLWAGYEKDDVDHWIVCSMCNQLIIKASHSWDEGTVTKPATESETGIITYTCTECTMVKEEILTYKPHVHTWSTSLSSNETHHWYACTGCSEKNEVISHLWHSGIVIKPATKKETGIMSYTCAYCQYVKEEIIPREGLTLADVNMDGEFNESDTNALLQHITGYNNKIDEEVSDVNGDGEVNIRDAAMLLLSLKDPNS